MWLTLSLTGNVLSLAVLLAVWFIGRRRRYRKDGKGRLSRWLFSRKPDAASCFNDGENWILIRLAPFHPSIVFDVGANVGDWSALARSALPDAQIHSFEIVESTCGILRERFANSTGVVINNFGLSDKTGTITMHLFESAKDNNLTSHVAYPHGAYREIACPVRTGDEYMRGSGVKRIDFLKIDVEGAEHLVLNGFGTAIDAGEIDVIQFEYGRVNIITHFLLRDFYEFFESRGYLVGKLCPDHVDFRAYTLEDEDFIGPNYVAVRKMRPEIVEALRKH